MKRKIWAFMFVLGIFSVSACAPAITPVFVSPVPVSPSPLPPTFLSPAIIPVPTATPMEECNQNPPTQPKGSLVNVKFENQSGGDVNLSFGMNTPNDKNECVTYSYDFAESSIASAQVLAGCYWGYGWVQREEGPGSAKTHSQLCLTDANIVYHVLIMKETIVLQ
jgi:hypothetical protein